MFEDDAVCCRDGASVHLSVNLNLSTITLLNEEIKKVVTISSGMNLLALNAMLVVKRAGEGANGFRVVSSELRVFSRKFEEAMSSLGGHVFNLVGDVARLQKLAREYAYLACTGNESPRNREILAVSLIKKKELLAEREKETKVDERRLIEQLERALKLCETGNALSRSAKIEAVYGGAMTAALKQVADQVEHSVTDIISTLKLLKYKLAE